MDLMQIRRTILQYDGIPPEYQRVDYLQIQGRNAKINTGVPGNNENLVLDFEFATITRYAYGAFTGNYSVVSTARCWSVANPSGTGDVRNYNICCYNRAGSSSASVYVVPSGKSMTGVRVRFIISNGKIVVHSDGFDNTVNPAASGSDDSISADNIMIGTNSANPSNSGGGLIGRFWYYKIYDSKRLIRNYVPCYRKSDNKAGFYDTVNHTFNPSIGSVEFTAGND